MDTANLWTWIVSGLCVILVGIAKAGFAGGIGVIATPLLSLVMSPTQAAAILLPLLCGCDVVSICFYRGVFSLRSLKELLPGSALGIALGALTIAYFQGKPEMAEKGLKMLIGWISILFVIYQVGRGWIQEELERYHPKGWHGWLFGGSAGFTSALAHAGGPPVAMYLLPQHLDRRLFVGTTGMALRAAPVADAKAARTADASARSSLTAPTSLLCTRSRATTLSATGNPISAAMHAAASASGATASRVTEMP